jgi:hypothetical protein
MRQVLLALVLLVGCASEPSTPRDVGADASAITDLRAPDLSSPETRCSPDQPAGLCAGQPCESGCRCSQILSSPLDASLSQQAFCDCSSRTATYVGDYLCCDGVWCEPMGSIAPACDDPLQGPGCYPGFL